MIVKVPVSPAAKVPIAHVTDPVVPTVPVHAGAPVPTVGAVAEAKVVLADALF